MRVLTTVQSSDKLTKVQQQRAAGVPQNDSRWYRLCDGRSTERNVLPLVRLATVVRHDLGVMDTAGPEDVSQHVLLKPAPFSDGTLHVRDKCQQALSIERDDTAASLNSQKFVTRVIAELRTQSDVVNTVGLLVDPTHDLTLKGACPHGIVTRRVRNSSPFVNGVTSVNFSHCCAQTLCPLLTLR